MKNLLILTIDILLICATMGCIGGSGTRVNVRHSIFIPENHQNIEVSVEHVF